MTIPPAPPPDPSGYGHRNDYTGHAHTALQATAIYGGLHLTTTAGHTSAPVPAQLRAAPACWADRAAELHTLTRFTTPPATRPHDGRTDNGRTDNGRTDNGGDGDPDADQHGDAQTLIVITGPGGVGKTALALRWLHQRRTRYRDGQLFTDLRAFSGTNPADPAPVLEGFLRALGIRTDSIPRSASEQAALFRSVAAQRRLIILLDNAASAAQVRPLLPGAGRNLIVVTSRRSLPALRIEGARYLELAPLDETGALDLLTAMAGADRAAADPHAARALVAQCGRLPLALTACAAHLATRPHTTVSRLAGHLADERTRLSHLHTLLEDHHMNDNDDTGDTGDTGDRSISAALTTSYNALPDAARRMYRLLSLHPGPDLDRDLAAAALAVDHHEAERLLDTVTGARLLAEEPAGRFGYHDLARLHARQTTEEIDADDVRAGVIARITSRLLRVAVAAQKTINPGRWYLGRHFTRPPVVAFADPLAALDWLETERDNLMAVLQHAQQHGDPTSAWQICEAMWGLFTHRKHYQLFQQAHQIGLAAAHATGDLRAQARMLEGLASYHNNASSFADATACAQQALDLERQAGHLLGEASALDMLGIAHLAAGHHDHAQQTFARARDIHHQLGRPRGAALMTRHLGQVAAAAGHHDHAIELFTQAIEHFAAHEHESYLHARALTPRATSHLELDHLDQAGADLDQAMELAQVAGAPHEIANIHTALARLAALHDDPATHQHHLQRALDLYRHLNAPQANLIAEQLTQPPQPQDPTDPRPDRPGNP